MNMLEMLETKVSPEQAAIWAEQRRRWTLGMEAGEAGLPCPEDAAPMAYKSGVAKRRVAAGEIIGFVMQSSRCTACGEGNYGWRLGCRCWPTDKAAFPPPGYYMEYGYQVDPGSDPDAPDATFMTGKRLFDLARAGREVIDVMRGEPVPIDLSTPPTSSEKENQ